MLTSTPERPASRKAKSRTRPSPRSPLPANQAGSTDSAERKELARQAACLTAAGLAVLQRESARGPVDQDVLDFLLGRFRELNGVITAVNGDDEGRATADLAYVIHGESA